VLADRPRCGRPHAGGGAGLPDTRLAAVPSRWSPPRWNAPSGCGFPPGAAVAAPMACMPSWPCITYAVMAVHGAARW